MAQRYTSNQPQGQGARSQQGGGYGNRQTDALPTARPHDFYDDQSTKKVLHKKFVDEEAKSRAETFASMKSTQMRRFYDDVKAIERKIMLEGDEGKRKEAFEAEHAMIVMLKPKAVYAQKRGTAPAKFTQFIFDNVDSIRDLRDFEAFVRHFEAVVAYHKFFAED
jgi:CRISPR-associated protein Csm2